ncbi:MAG: polyketide synthase dehydratase domain-containing protein [Smithella sp.]|nr:polyketide synthase dehydratase domain-containing protein [Smithella sp.]
MEIVSGLNQKKRYLSDMEVHPYLRDHYWEGKVILPAVEALIILARAVKINCPQLAINRLKHASFSRFLNIAPATGCLPLLIDMEGSADGGMIASLVTSIKSRTSDIRREVEHANVKFSAFEFSEYDTLPSQKVNKLEGDCISVPASTIYRDLVPFGKAYQNIVGDLSVSPEGALAYVSGGGGEADDDLLGSPFPLDAVFHAACIWGQRFADRVCLPVGFEERIVCRKTKKGEAYLARIMPVSVTQEMLMFDAWIYKDDVLCEKINGIQMKDVTKGRIRPPDWIRL